MDDGSGPNNPNDQTDLRSPITATADDGSGPNNPNDQTFLQAEVTITSGPNNPNDQDAFSGPNNPNDQGDAAVFSGSGADWSGTAAAPAPISAIQSTAQSVSVRLGIAKPHPFSVYLSSSAGDAVQILSLDVRIWNNETSVFNTVIAVKAPISLVPDVCNVFPLTDEQLSTVLPKLQVGTTVQVDVSYSAPVGSKLTVGIIGKDSYSKLGTFIERLLHSER